MGRPCLSCGGIERVPLGPEWTEPIYMPCPMCKGTGRATEEGADE